MSSRCAPCWKESCGAALSCSAATAGSICSVDEAAGTYRKEADIGVACQSGSVFPLTEGMTGAVVARRAPVWFARYDEVHGGHVAALERATLRGVIGVPLEWRGRVIGACIVFSRDERRVFGPDDAELLELFARHAAIALATARMHEVSEERARAEAAAAERDRLLGEVHDSLAQRLVSIRVYLDGAERDLAATVQPTASSDDAADDGISAVAAQLRQASTAARDALAEARLTLLGLASSPLNGQTLDTALRSEAAWAQSMGGLEVRYVSAGRPPRWRSTYRRRCCESRARRSPTSSGRSGAFGPAWPDVRADGCDEVRNLVGRSGLSKQDFAERIGTSRSRLSTYMSGKVVPSAALMVRMRRVALQASETVTHAAG